MPTRKPRTPYRAEQPVIATVEQAGRKIQVHGTIDRVMVAQRLLVVRLVDGTTRKLAFERVEIA